jgi:hypothetical protein
VRNGSGKEIFVDGYKTDEIAISGRPMSFYTNAGDIFILACLVLVIFGTIVGAKRKTKA